MIACASSGGVSGPKFMVPRQRRLTERPERPRCVYSMTLAFHTPGRAKIISIRIPNGRVTARIPVMLFL
jgi:hypothetical protein